MTAVNEGIINHLNHFFSVSNKIGLIKDKMGLPHFDPVRESEMLKDILMKTRGPMPAEDMQRVFMEIFKVSVKEMGAGTRQKLNVSRSQGKGSKVIDVGG
ncbi:MAG: chorismate mutase, partial [Deltaproteobacteria bacterium]|nr:chorismate mutase [Deltaproteobacteria bacterium]